MSFCVPLKSIYNSNVGTTVFIICRYGSNKMGRDSSVGIATHFELDGQGIESRWGEKFSAPVQTGPGVHRVPGLSRG